MGHSEYSFWKLISNFSIEIPMIQRDYAQGRNEGTAPYIRNNILTAIAAAVTGNKKLDFDFIYGRIERQVSGKPLFIPIDGQQRITTLFLLHWYLANKDEVPMESTEALGGFRYATRTSSTAFCKALASNRFAIPGQDSPISEVIKDNRWFVASWELDPTVASMLVMLDAIHHRFAVYPGLFARITDPEQAPITFQFTEMEQLGLTDKVYIKMNSRGKSLTEFENFKALFEQFLEKNHRHLKDRFATNIDGVWADFFWNYRKNNLIDVPFMNVFTYVTKVLYYRSVTEGTDKFEEFSKKTEVPDYWKQIYQKEENVEFLFSTLDFFLGLGDSKAFFDSIFSGQTHLECRVALFYEETDLLRRCMEEQEFNIPEEVLLYAIIRYKSRHPDPAGADELCDRLRIIRNRLERVRQLNWPKYNTNLRYEQMEKYLDEAELLSDLEVPIYSALSTGSGTAAFPGDSLQVEVQKAAAILEVPGSKGIIHRIEDDPIFRGTIHSLFSGKNQADLEELYAIFKEVLRCPTTLVIRAMLATGFRGINVGDSGIGDRWYFCSGKPAYWNTLLTFKDQSEISLVPFLSSFRQFRLAGEAAPDTLNRIIQSWLARGEDFGAWRYYFVKYEVILSGPSNQFAWLKDSGNFEIRKLVTRTARGYHINPYVSTVAALVDNSAICDVNACYSLGYEFSPLVLKNGTFLWCEESGWRIVIPEDLNLAEAQFTSLEATGNPGEYLLKDPWDKDRVESALEFVLGMYGSTGLTDPATVRTLRDYEDGQKGTGADEWRIMKMTEFQGWNHGKQAVTVIQGDGKIYKGTPEGPVYQIVGPIIDTDFPIAVSKTASLSASDLARMDRVLANSRLSQIPSGDLGSCIVMDGQQTHIIYDSGEHQFLWSTKSDWGDYAAPLGAVEDTLDELAKAYL